MSAGLRGRADAEGSGTTAARGTGPTDKMPEMGDESRLLLLLL